MRKLESQYDVIIVGAGIGGLVCGCYLAKAGMKVLIVEQHDKVGGYCTSFNREGFTFEAGAVEDLSEGSFFREIIEELNININITRLSPNLLIYTPNDKIRLGIMIDEIINYFQERFPKERASTEKFFRFIEKYSIASVYYKYKDKTFDQLLDEYFRDEDLRKILNMVLSQIGAVHSRVSALSAITYFRSFVLGGGYYPEGGLQRFSEAFATKFKEFGGEVKLSTSVRKIVVNRGKATGIVLSNGEEISADFVISNADAMQTFVKLIDHKNIRKDSLSLIEKLVPSVSVFIVYLGIKKKIGEKFENCHEIWDTKNCDDDPFNRFASGSNFNEATIYCYAPSFRDASMAPLNCESISLCVFTPSFERTFWESKREVFAKMMIERISKTLSFSETDIIVKETAIPQTLHRYTLNIGGAFKGWAPILGQVDISTMPAKTEIENLFLAGHWVTTGAGESGVPQAAYSGRKVSQLILRSIKKA